jgi:Undecaprenyl-phosphate galactose phosphotransferase WbaP
MQTATPSVAIRVPMPVRVGSVTWPVWLQSLALVVGDLVTMALCMAAAWWIKALQDSGLPSEQYLQAFSAILVVQVLVHAGMGLFPGLGLGPAEELRRLTQATTMVLVIGVIVTFVAKAGETWSRQVMLVTWGLALVALPFARCAMRRLLCRRSWWGIPCVVVGAGATGRQVVGLLQARPWLGLRPVVLLDDDERQHGRMVEGVPVRGPIREEVAALAQRGVRSVILAIPSLSGRTLSAMLANLHDHARTIYVAPALPGSPHVVASTREFANTLVLEIRQNLLRPATRVAKRILDLLLVMLGLVVSIPLVLTIALMIAITSRGPVLYGQKRLGKNGREFVAWKFRSMVCDADERLELYLAAHPALQEEWRLTRKLRNDPRVTWIGALLRRSSLDELPQLWNVLRGEMSLVGPRPIVRDEIPRYGEEGYRLYIKTRPGLSGLWQVSGRSDTSYRERVALDSYYVHNWSVWLDLVILARTLRVVFLGKGAY